MSWKEGVRRMGEHLRLNIQLVDGSSEEHLWAQRFDCTEAELFDVQHDISVRISTQLSGSVTEAESDRAKLMPSHELDSWLLTQRAIHEYFSGAAQETYEEAIGLVEQALRVDPKYPYALGLHALLITTGVLLGFREDKQASFQIADDQIQHALQLAPNDPMVLWCWGVVQGFSGNKPSAIVTLERAIDGNPNDPHIVADLGHFLVQTGRVEEGVALLRKAFELSPHEPRAYVWHSFLGTALAHSDLEASLREFDRSIALFNKYIPSLAAKYVALHLLGREDDAQAAAGMLFEIHPQLSVQQLHQMYKMSIDDPEILARYIQILDLYAPREKS